MNSYIIFTQKKINKEAMITPSSRVAASRHNILLNRIRVREMADCGSGAWYVPDQLEKKSVIPDDKEGKKRNPKQQQQQKPYYRHVKRLSQVDEVYTPKVLLVEYQ